jgi:thiol-disulfide isomerase/thioredoxin
MRQRIAGFFLAVTLCSVPFAPAFGAGRTLLPVGASAPPVNEPTAKGVFDSTTSTKPYVIEFFAVWCPVCQGEVPVVNKLQLVDGDRADIIAIPASPFGFDKSTTLQPADLDTFASRFKTTYRIGFDGFFSTSYDYGLTSFPTFYVVDVSRHVTAVESGAVPFEKLHADILAALR